MKNQLAGLFYILIFSISHFLAMNFDSQNPFSDFFYNPYYISPLKTSEIMDLTKNKNDLVQKNNLVEENISINTLKNQEITIKIIGKNNKINDEKADRLCQYCNERLAHLRGLYNHENFYCKVARAKNIIVKNYTCPHQNCHYGHTQKYGSVEHLKKCRYANE